jgi:hypothetical protein
MLSEIFMLRLEALARVAAQEAPQYTSGTARERSEGLYRLYTDEPMTPITKTFESFANTSRPIP